MSPLFKNRHEAGKRLAERIAALGLDDPVILALPRGGVPVAMATAQRLRAPLDLLMVRKLGAPGQDELAIGAVVDGAAPHTVFNPALLAAFGLSEADCEPAIRDKLRDIAARRDRYLAGLPPVAIAGRDVVIIDDGIATGATVRAALLAVREQSPKTVVLAVPVAPAETLDALSALVDITICLETPRPFVAVGAHYLIFDQTGDAEVVALLREAAGWRASEEKEKDTE